MQKDSRTYNILRNSAVTIACQLITIILGFVCRKALIVSLGLPYAGANALFSNIIGMLAFLELGVGHAITYSLYKPIADDNKEQIAACINFFSKLYHWVALAIFVVGLVFLPFLDSIVNVEQGIRENVYIMYLLTLAHTCSTYLLAAPKTLLIASQKEYVVNIIYQICHILQVALQVAVLFIWKDYYLFLIIQIATTLLYNSWTSTLVYNQNPFISKMKEKISNVTKSELIENIKSSFLYKVGSSFLNHINSVFVGYFCGLTLLGKISLYSLILATISNVLIKTATSFTATVGNKGAAESIDSSRATFFKSHFLISWFSYLFLGGYLLFSSDFVRLFFGKDCTIDFSLVLVLGLLTFVSNVHSISSTYRFALGFFKKGRLAPLYASIMNIGLSFLFYYMFGIVGLYIAPITSRIVTLACVDSYLIVGGYRGIYKYFKVMAIYSVVFVIIYLPCHFLVLPHHGMGFISLCFWAIAYVIVFSLAWWFVFRNNENCKGVLLAISKTFGKKIKKK